MEELFAKLSRDLDARLADALQGRRGITDRERNQLSRQLASVAVEVLENRQEASKKEQVRSIPLTLKASASHAEASRKRLQELDPHLETLRKEHFYFEDPPVTDERDVERLRTWKDRQLTESAWDYIGMEEDAREVLSKAVGTPGSWPLLMRSLTDLSNTSGFGAGQLVYRLLTGEDIELPTAVIQVEEGGPYRRGSTAVIRLFRPLTYVEVRRLHSALADAWKIAGESERERERRVLRTVVREALENEKHPWSTAVWENKIRKLWEARGMPSRSGDTLRRRYNRLFKRVLTGIIEELNAGPSDLRNSAFWEGTVYPMWMEEGMIPTTPEYLKERYERWR